jgi:hypothetical protein
MPLGDFPVSSRAGVGAKTAAPYDLKSKDPVSQPYVPATVTLESVQGAEIGAGNSRIPGLRSLEALLDERILEIHANRSATMADNRGAGTNTTSGFMSPNPQDFATTPARQAVPTKDATGSSSTQHDLFSTIRRGLLADPDSALIFAAMEEWDYNSWRQSMLVLHDDDDDDDDDDEQPEQVEPMSLDEAFQLERLPRSEPCNPVPEGFTPSYVHPDDGEPGPSTRAPPMVPPLADHEVPTFDCGLCKNTLPVFDLFHGLPCEHRFCAQCMTTYVEGRIRAGGLPIPCPDAACGGGALHPEKCKKAIDYAVFNDWGAGLAERALPPNSRAYCPNHRRELLLVEISGAEQAMAPCPECGHALVRKPGA